MSRDKRGVVNPVVGGSSPPATASFLQRLSGDQRLSAMGGVKTLKFDSMALFLPHLLPFLRSQHRRTGTSRDPSERTAVLHQTTRSDRARNDTYRPPLESR
jgi:hypothetical protein